MIPNVFILSKQPDKQELIIMEALLVKQQKTILLLLLLLKEVGNARLGKSD